MERPMTPHPWRIERHGTGFELIHRHGSAVDRYPLAWGNVLTLARDLFDALIGLCINAGERPR
jgi:hypothetical protein